MPKTNQKHTTSFLPRYMNPISLAQQEAIRCYFSMDEFKKTSARLSQHHGNELKFKITRKKYLSDQNTSIRHLKFYNAAGNLLETIPLPHNENDSGKNSMVGFFNKNTKKSSFYFHASKEDEPLVKEKQQRSIVECIKDFTDKQGVFHPAGEIFREPIHAETNKNVVVLGHETIKLKNTISSTGKKGVVKIRQFHSFFPVQTNGAQEESLVYLNRFLSRKLDSQMMREKLYMEGFEEDLLEFLIKNRTRLKEHHKTQLADVLINLVINLHESGYVHTDIKLENIGINVLHHSTTGEIIFSVGLFDLEEAFSWKLDEKPRGKGTIGYLPPEFFKEGQFPGAARLARMTASEVEPLLKIQYNCLFSKASDIYALGLILQLLELPNEYKGLIRCALSVNPENRLRFLETENNQNNALHNSLKAECKAILRCFEPHIYNFLWNGPLPTGTYVSFPNRNGSRMLRIPQQGDKFQIFPVGPSDGDPGNYSCKLLENGEKVLIDREGNEFAFPSLADISEEVSSDSSSYSSTGFRR